MYETLHAGRHIKYSTRHVLFMLAFALPKYIQHFEWISRFVMCYLCLHCLQALSLFKFIYRSVNVDVCTAIIVVS